MHNLVWLIIAISVGIIFGFFSGGLFSADYSSIWPALGSIGTVGAWYFLYQQSKATTEQMRLANEQLQVSQLATYRSEIRHSIDRIVEYLMDGEQIRFDRLSWINASVEVENIELLIASLPEGLRKADTERFGRLLDSKLPRTLFQSELGSTILLSDEMVRVHRKRHRSRYMYERCNIEFAGRSYLLKVYMFTREYEFSVPPDFQFRNGNFFRINPDLETFKCDHCSNVMNK